MEKYKSNNLEVEAIKWEGKITDKIIGFIKPNYLTVLDCNGNLGENIDVLTKTSWNRLGKCGGDRWIVKFPDNSYGTFTDYEFNLLFTKING